MDILADRERRKANKDAARQRGRDYVAIHSCIDCGERDPVVLPFDHVRGTKQDNVSDIVRDGPGLETIKTEIEKCEVVCYNYHSLRMQEHSGAYRWRMGKVGRE